MEFLSSDAGDRRRGGADVRFIIMHKTDARSESGAHPGAELIARVGRMIGALSRAGALEAGEGLGPSSKGVRLRFDGGAREIVRWPVHRTGRTAGCLQHPSHANTRRRRRMGDRRGRRRRRRRAGHPPGERGLGHRHRSKTSRASTHAASWSSQGVGRRPKPALQLPARATRGAVPSHRGNDTRRGPTSRERPCVRAREDGDT